MRKIIYIFMLLLLIVIFTVPIKLNFYLSYYKNNAKAKIVISCLFFSYNIKIKNRNIKRSLKIFGKHVNIKKEKLEYIYSKDLFGSLFLYNKETKLDKIVKLRNRTIKFLFLASNCTYFCWTSEFYFANHALTAFLSGVLWSIKVNAILLLDDKIKLTRQPIIFVKPLFKKNIANQSRVIGIFNYKLGNIILMLVNRLINQLKRKVVINVGTSN